MSKETWTYTQDNPDNPNKGEVRSNSGELICVRAVMNPDDERVMRWIAAAPDLLTALEELDAATLEFSMASAVSFAAAWNEGAGKRIKTATQRLAKAQDVARAAIAKARGEKP